jgi:hypothetical protein
MTGTEDSATIQVYRHGMAAQRHAKQTITFTAQGFRMLPMALRYCWPSQRLATSACLARTASAAPRSAASSWSVRSLSTTARTPDAPISASTPR